MQHVDKLGKIYYAPIKANRNVARVNSSVPYKAVSKMEMTKDEIENGVEIHIKGFAKDSHVKLFQYTVSTNRVDYIVTNDKSQTSSKAAQNEFSSRWVIESMHREIKQLTGIEETKNPKKSY